MDTIPNSCLWRNKYGVLAIIAPGFLAFKATAHHVELAQAWLAAAEAKDQGYRNMGKRPVDTAEGFVKSSGKKAS